MRTIAVVLAIICLMMVGTTVWAEEQVVTIYFAGTGATENWYTSDISFGKPELLATLHRDQFESETSHKFFINGIGTGCGCGCWWDWSITWVNIFSKSDAEIELCRGWNTCLTEAEGHLNDVLQNYSGDVILNLVGWSRGGVLTMRFANRVYGNSRIKRINILAIDPAGHRTLGGDLQDSISAGEFCLNEKVKQYIGIYATDERSFMFGPAIPGHSAATEVWMVRVPGGHENIVGSDKTGCGFLWMDECPDDNLLPVSRVVKAIAKKLLSSSQWGNVSIRTVIPCESESDLDCKLTRSNFIEQANAMPTYSYYSTRKHSIAPIGFEGYGLLWKLLPWPPHWEEGCWWGDLADWLTFEEYEAPRCASHITCQNEHTTVNLEAEILPLQGEDAWAKLEQLTNSPPVALCKDTTVPADSTCKGPALIDNGSYDSDEDQITLGQIPEGPYSKGNTSVTLTVADTKGASSQCSGTVTVVDLQAPNLTCPAPQIIDATGPGGVVVNFTPTTSDNCPGAISVSCTQDSGTMFAIGSTSVTCNAKDASDNSTSCSFNVTIRGATDQINSLAALVKGFNLQSGIGNSLVSKLSNARAQFSVRNSKAACNVIDAFINEISAQTGNMITADQANQMITNALRIKAAMGC